MPTSTGSREMTMAILNISHSFYLVHGDFHVKIKNERVIVVCSRCRPNLKIGLFCVVLHCRIRQRKSTKMRVECARAARASCCTCGTIVLPLLLNNNAKQHRVYVKRQTSNSRLVIAIKGTKFITCLSLLGSSLIAVDNS